MKGSQNKISCKVEKMAAKARYIKGCHVLAEMTPQLNQNDWKPGKNVAIIGNSIVLPYLWGIRKGCNFAIHVGIWKWYHFGKNMEPPCIKLYWVAPPAPPPGCWSYLTVALTRQYFVFTFPLWQHTWKSCFASFCLNTVKVTVHLYPLVHNM